MTEKEFLRKVSYCINEDREEMEVWWNNQVLATLSFSNNPRKLEDDAYLTELSYEVALESSLANKMITK